MWSISSVVHNPRRGLASVIVGCLVIATAVTIGGPSASADAGAETFGQPVNFNGEQGALSGVSCSDPVDCTAVGGIDAGASYVTEVDGVWGSPVTLPSAAGSIENSFASVSCVDPADCTAVGMGVMGDPVPLVATEAKGVWGPVLALTPLAEESYFQGVSCTSAGNCVAVGVDGNLDPVEATEIDGAWGPVFDLGDPAQTGIGQLLGVSCPAPGDCTAVGYNGGGGLIATESNGVWQPLSVVPAANNFLTAVSCSDPRDCTAVERLGTYLTETNGVWGPPTLLENGDSVSFASVSCSDPTDCVAVGEGVVPGYAIESDGIWGPVVAASSIYSIGPEFTGVSCTGPVSCTAVVSYGVDGGVAVSTITPVSYRVNGSQTFGSSAPTFSLGGSAPAGNSFAGTLTCTELADPSEPISSSLAAGTYSVDPSSCSGLTLTGPTASNYQVSLTGGTLTVDLALTSSVPDPVKGIAYSTALSAVGGTAPYTWTITSGSLPTGLTLSPSGVISGTPTAVQSQDVTFKATDSGSPKQSATTTFTINTVPVAITTTSLPAGPIDVAYKGTIAAVGGKKAYKFTVVSGSLPAGIKLATTGALTGTPTAAGTSTFTVQVADASKPINTGTKTLSITVTPMMVATTSLPVGLVGKAYTGKLVTSGGKTAFKWAVTSGAIPAGLKLATTGTISGTPTSGGTSTLTVTVTDSAKPADTASVTLSITITPMTITTTSLPAGTVKKAYTATLVANGGVGTKVWTLTSGPLPPGLKLSTAGKLTGTPTAAGSYPITVQVTDAAKPTKNTATASYTITIG